MEDEGHSPEELMALHSEIAGDKRPIIPAKSESNEYYNALRYVHFLGLIIEDYLVEYCGLDPQSMLPKKGKVNPSRLSSTLLEQIADIFQTEIQVFSTEFDTLRRPTEGDITEDSGTYFSQNWAIKPDGAEREIRFGILEVELQKLTSVTAATILHAAHQAYLSLGPDVDTPLDWVS